VPGGHLHGRARQRAAVHGRGRHADCAVVRPTCLIAVGGLTATVPFTRDERRRHAGGHTRTARREGVLLVFLWPGPLSTARCVSACYGREGAESLVVAIAKQQAPDRAQRIVAS
jgi:hypothetical protein